MTVQLWSCTRTLPSNMRKAVRLPNVGDRYQVTFGKVGGTWCIVDIVSEEMIAYGMTPDSFNLDAAIAEFDRLQEQGPVVQMVEPENGVEEGVEPAALSDAINTYRYYNRDNAAAYAYTYTTDSYTENSGNNSNFLNDNFCDYSESGGIAKILPHSACGLDLAEVIPVMLLIV